MTITLLTGDCRDILRTLPTNSVHCCVTSPPYFGLRSYVADEHPDKAREIGQEPTLKGYVAALGEVFREVKRVLRPDGVAWLNLGDSYAGSWGAQAKRITPGEISRNSVTNHPKRASGTGTIRDAGLKAKDLMLVPTCVALALQAGFSRCDGCGLELRSDLWPVWNGHKVCMDCRQSSIVESEKGWWVRSDVIWHKASCMPESVTDRPSSCFEHVFLLAKSSRYFYDNEAVKEPTEQPDRVRADRMGGKSHEERQQHSEGGLFTGASNRNLRNLWSINPQGSDIAHFAMMPPALAERCVRAGTSETGCCPSCGAPWARVVETGEPDIAHQRACGGDAAGSYAGQATKDYASASAQDASAVKARILAGMRTKRTAGWQPTCACPPHEPVSCTVLDPFAGAGTTLLAADRLGRHGIGIELSRANTQITRQRILDDAGMFAAVAAE